MDQRYQRIWSVSTRGLLKWIGTTDEIFTLVGLPHGGGNEVVLGHNHDQKSEGNIPTKGVFFICRRFTSGTRSSVQGSDCPTRLFTTTVWVDSKYHMRKRTLDFKCVDILGLRSLPRRWLFWSSKSIENVHHSWILKTSSAWSTMSIMTHRWNKRLAYLDLQYCMCFKSLWGLVVDLYLTRICNFHTEFSLIWLWQPQSYHALTDSPTVCIAFHHPEDLPS